MRNDVLDLIWGFNGLFRGCDGITGLNLNLLDDSVDNVGLKHIFRSTVLELFHDGNNHHGKLLILIETDFDFSFGMGLGGGSFYIISSRWVGLGNLFLVFSILLFSLISVKFILNVYFKFNIILLNADVWLLQKSANLFDVSHCDDLWAVSSSKCLGESDQRLKVSHSHWIWLSLLLVSLSDCFILFFQHNGGLLGELRIDGSRELDISL